MIWKPAVEKGIWGPDAIPDRGNDMLFRTQAAANAYFSAKRAGEQRQAAETAAQNADATRMLLAIRRANDRIDDEVLSAKIDWLETVTGQIFKVIQEQPAKKNQASTFLNYYLPTTQKLLDSRRPGGGAKAGRIWISQVPHRGHHGQHHRRVRSISLTLCIRTPPWTRQ